MTPNPPQPGAQAKYALPVVAFVLSLIGFCFCPTALIGGILGIVAWVRISKEPHLPGKGLAIAATFMPLAVLPIAGILSAIAIPNFIKFQARSKQTECKANLRAIYSAHKSFEGPGGKAATTFEELGVHLERGNRYHYFLSATEVHAADATRWPQTAADDASGALARAGVEVGGEAGAIAACVGNVDNDATMDVWTVSDDGMPRNVVNDVMD